MSADLQRRADFWSIVKKKKKKQSWQECEQVTNTFCINKVDNGQVVHGKQIKNEVSELTT